MLRNMTKSLLKHGRIVTTETRAKELSSFVDGVITDAKRAHEASDPVKKLNYKRKVFRHFSTQTSQGDRRKRGMKSQRPHREIAQELFDRIAPQYCKGGELERSSGYTRVLKIYPPRKGDGARRAMIELVGHVD
jgi:large subunit ribosomal protein L17